MADKIVIWGASGHALVVTDIIRLCGDYEIVGCLDDLNPERHNTDFNGLRIIGGREQLDLLRHQGVGHIIFGFGNCAARLQLTELVREKGFALATAVHPRSIVADSVRVGAGSIIAAGAVVNPAAMIGENVIINTAASIDHECVIDDGAHICPGATLGGGVTIGRAAWVGIGATIKDHLRVGARTIIGAGAVVVHDIPEGVVAWGVPAKVMRENGKP
jgi:UDP-N-acetylbacillosamine N-acetyltransferase